jgi:hypothetical protein
METKIFVITLGIMLFALIIINLFYQPILNLFYQPILNADRPRVTYEHQGITTKYYDDGRVYVYRNVESKPVKYNCSDIII